MCHRSPITTTQSHCCLVSTPLHLTPSACHAHDPSESRNFLEPISSSKKRGSCAGLRKMMQVKTLLLQRLPVRSGTGTGLREGNRKLLMIVFSGEKTITGYYPCQQTSPRAYCAPSIKLGTGDMRHDLGVYSFLPSSVQSTLTAHPLCAWHCAQQHISE